MQTEKTDCKYFGKCGGCDLIGIPYPEQLLRKGRYLEKQLGKMAASNGCTIENVVAAEDPYYYRNKVHSVFFRDKKGKILRGMYREESHKVVDVSGCLLENRIADAVISEIKHIAETYRMKIYDEDTGYGFLRHVLVRTAVYKGKPSIMAVIVTAQVQFEGKNNFIRLLTKKFPEISTIVQNINNKRTSMVLGERNIVLYGRGYVLDDSLGLEFRISPSSFFQIIPAQTVKLYGLALEMAAPRGTDTVLDAYCGTGTIGLFMSRSAGRVIGVELNREAVKDAIFNAERNKITNAEFICSDATQFMKDCNEKIDILCMDPPRSGSTEEFINAAADLAIPRVVYVSCDPESLSRDLKVFLKKDYVIRRIVPVDMFPHTDKCEAVTLLEKK